MDEISFTTAHYWRFVLLPPGGTNDEKEEEVLEVTILGNTIDDIIKIRDHTINKYGNKIVRTAEFFQITKNEVNGVILAEKDGIITEFEVIDRLSIPINKSKLYRKKLKTEDINNGSE